MAPQKWPPQVMGGLHDVLFKVFCFFLVGWVGGGCIGFP